MTEEEEALLSEARSGASTRVRVRRATSSGYTVILPGGGRAHLLNRDAHGPDDPAAWVEGDEVDVCVVKVGHWALVSHNWRALPRTMSARRPLCSRLRYLELFG